MKTQWVAKIVRLKKAGVSVAVDKNQDSGAALWFLTGKTGETQNAAKKCAEMLNAYKTVIVYDPVDLKLMLHEYKEWGIEIKVKIVSFNEYVLSLLETGKLKAKKSANEYSLQDNYAYARDLDDSETGRKIIEKVLKKSNTVDCVDGGEKLDIIHYVGELEEVANRVAHTAIRLDVSGKTPEEVAQEIEENNIKSVLWEDSEKLKILAPKVAVLTGAGLCADCISFRIENGKWVMTRPALGGNITADIVCDKEIAFATVRATSFTARSLLHIRVATTF